MCICCEHTRCNPLNLMLIEYFDQPDSERPGYVSTGESDD